ncbi:MAG: hypothetical protein AAF413_01580 [Patescibacteria group bacterium]
MRTNALQKYRLLSPRTTQEAASAAHQDRISDGSGGHYTWLEYAVDYRGFDEKTLTELVRMSGFGGFALSRSLFHVSDYLVAGDVEELCAQPQLPVHAAGGGRLHIMMSLCEVPTTTVQKVARYGRLTNSEKNDIDKARGLEAFRLRMLGEHSGYTEESIGAMSTQLFVDMTPTSLAIFHLVCSSGPKSIVGLNRQLINAAAETH